MKARDIHEKATVVCESGESLEALKLCDEATVLYEQENDLLGMAEIQAQRFIIFKHLYQKTGNRAYIVLALSSSQTSVEIAQLSEDTHGLCLPYMNLGEAYALDENWEQAVAAYRKAVEWFEKAPPPHHNRESVLLNIKDHLYTAEYKTGDKSALGRAENLIPELEATDEDSYNKNVWLSGAHGRIAEMIYKEDLKKALEHLQKAKEIIDSDERLVLRKMQWEKLNKLINSGTTA
jgi:tetratricopeptide (TPR) repeat protein